MIKQISLALVAVLFYLGSPYMSFGNHSELVLEGFSLSCSDPISTVKRQYFIDDKNQKIVETNESIRRGIFSIESSALRFGEGPESSQIVFIEVRVLPELGLVNGVVPPPLNRGLALINCPVRGEGSRKIRRLIESKDDSVKYIMEFTVSVNGLTATLSDIVFKQKSSGSVLPPLNLLLGE